MFAYVGSYTSVERGGKNCGGITVFESNGNDTSKWKKIQEYEIENPSYLTTNSQKDKLYTVQADGDCITAFSINENGYIRYINEIRTGFYNGVYLQLDPADKYLFTASAFDDGGSVCAIKIREDGGLDKIVDTKVPKGSPGPLKGIQDVTQPHQIKFDRQGKYQIEANRGLDTVNVWEMDYENVRLNLYSTTKWRPASCPRHIDCHPTLDIVYLLTEFFGSIVTMKYKDGILTPIESLPTIPNDFLGMKNSAAEIEVHPNGKTVYVSNRGHNSICSFNIGDDGRLNLLGWMTEGVNKPRFFLLTPKGEELICANEGGNNITRYLVDKKSGGLVYSGVIMEASAPTCIVLK